MHLLGVSNELIPEVRMGDANDLLGTLPGRKTQQLHLAVLGNDIVTAGTGIGGDRALSEGGNDAALEGTILTHNGRGHANEALTAVGQVCAHGEVQLTAGTGDMLNTGRLSIDLAKEVHVDGIVDGDKVIDLGHHADIVGVINGSGHDIGVTVDLVIQLLRAGCESKDLAALV